MTSSYRREAVFTRDDGHCQKCQRSVLSITACLDTIEDGLAMLEPDLARELRGRINKILRGLKFSDIGTPQWEINHITPRAQGGSDDIDNLELLCKPCHKDTTARWNRMRPKEKPR